MNIVFVGQNILGGRTLEGMLAHDIRPQAVVTRPRNDYGNMAERVARENHLRLEMTDDINRDHHLVSLLRGFRPDVIFCCSWGQRITSSLLSLPELGWVNFHPSYLPAYRGPCPIEWQLIDGVEAGGCTAHFMTPNFDDGPVIAQRRVSISPSDDGETMRHKCGLVLGDIAAECQQMLAANPAFKGTPQDDARASYAGPRESVRAIDWEMPAARVMNWVRGLSPYPCVLLRRDGNELSVAEIAITSIASRGNAGRLRTLESGELLIGTGDYYVLVIKVRVGGELVELTASRKEFSAYTT